MMKQESVGTREIKEVNFEMLGNAEGSNITEKFNLFYLQSIDNIVSSIEGNNCKKMDNRIVYDVENRADINQFEMINLKELEEIVMNLPNRAGTEEGITGDILKKVFRIIGREFVEVINDSLTRGCCPKE